MIVRLLISVVWLFSFLPFSASAQKWEPPYPDVKELVWIKLVSGEWLAGHVTSLRDKDLVFESEELDELHLDWDDIVEMRSALPMTFTFTELGTVTGAATMVQGVISVRIGEQILQYPRSGLLSIIEGEQTEWNYWSLKATAGIVARSGNTDQDDVNLYGFIRREAGQTRLDIEYVGNFGEVGGEQTIDNHDASVRFDWLITQGFFVTPFNMTLFSDRFQNIDLRSTFGAGVGYFITRTKDIEWSVTFGGGYQSTRYTSVLPGEERVKGTGIVIPGTILDMDLTGALEMKAEYYSQIGLADPKNTSHHTNLLFQLDVLGDILDFTLSFTWDHNTNPQSDENGIVPKKSDFRTSFGIGVDI
jgi:hypothetical protein